MGNFSGQQRPHLIMAEETNRKQHIGRCLFVKIRSGHAGETRIRGT